MTETPSFHKVDYSIRTNKNVERKIVFGMLSRLAQQLTLRDYSYIGFGSMWFVDFIFAHRLLGITSMWSIEQEDAARAEYNKPYSCIEIKDGSSARILSQMTEADWRNPLIAWLDYDGRFDLGVRSDCETLLKNCQPGSIVMITVNASRGSYKPVATSPAKTSLDVIRSMLGDAVPPVTFQSGYSDLTFEEFPDILARSILNVMTGTVRTCGRATEGYPDRFVPLFLMHHKDGSPMATIGGIVADWRRIPDFERLLGVDADELFLGGASLRDVIDLIPITAKEKFALDRLLPCSDDLFASKYESSGIKLSVYYANKYRQLYMHFPVFVETSL